MTDEFIELVYQRFTLASLAVIYAEVYDAMMRHELDAHLAHRFLRIILKVSREKQKEGVYAPN